MKGLVRWKYKEWLDTRVVVCLVLIGRILLDGYWWVAGFVIEYWLVRLYF